jgi:hypothetical protein
MVRKEILLTEGFRTTQQKKNCKNSLLTQMNFCKLFVDRDGIVQSFSGKHFHLSVTKS